MSSSTLSLRGSSVALTANWGKGPWHRCQKPAPKLTPEVWLQFLSPVFRFIMHPRKKIIAPKINVAESDVHDEFAVVAVVITNLRLIGNEKNKQKPVSNRKSSFQSRVYQFLACNRVVFYSMPESGTKRNRYQISMTNLWSWFMAPVFGTCVTDLKF